MRDALLLLFLSAGSTAAASETFPPGGDFPLLLLSESADTVVVVVVVTTFVVTTFTSTFPGSSLSMDLVIDDPAVLLVVSSSFSLGIDLASSFGGEMTTSSFSSLFLEVLLVDEMAGEGDRVRPGMLLATLDASFAEETSLLPIIFWCWPFHTLGNMGA